MKIQALYDLQQEINRLFIAGSKFSAGDPRLLKHVPVLNKLGEKAPVFKKLAADVETLTQSDSPDSAMQLLDISTLLYAVLYTQGTPVEEGLERREQIPSFQVAAVSTQHSYLQLKPVIDALSTSNQGRLEVLKDAYEQKVFSDFRTYQYLDRALGDKYAELADYVAETIIPSVGASILPFLVKSFAYEDKTEQVRRLRMLNALNYEQLPEMAEKIFAASLPNLQAEAIQYLVKHKENEPLVRKLADDKNKVVREAAYHALMQYGTEASIEKVKDIYCAGKANEGVVRALASSATTAFFAELLAQFNKTLDKLLALDKSSSDKEITDAVNRVRMELEIFQHKDRPEVYALFERIILNKNIGEILTAKKALLSYNAGGLADNIVYCLHTYDQDKVLDFYNKVIPEMQNAGWQQEFHRQYFHSCCAARYPAAAIFERFKSAFEKGYINVNDLQRQVFPSDRGHYYGADAFAAPDLDILDTRWMPYLYAIIEKKNVQHKWQYDNRTALMLLDACEPPDSKKLNEILTEIVKTRPANEIDFIFSMLLKRNIPDGFALIFNALDKVKKSTHYYYTNIGKAAFWRAFPKEYAQQIRELYERDKISVFDEIADTIEYN